MSNIFRIGMALVEPLVRIT